MHRRTIGSALILLTCLACTEPAEPGNEGEESESSGQNADSSDTGAPGDTGDTGETGDPQPRECGEGLTLCCPADSIDCEDEWGFPYDANNQLTPENQRWGCIDTSVSRYHCGGCAAQCPTDEIFAEDPVPTACSESTCAPTLGSQCAAASEGLTCTEVCALEQASCVAQGCYGDTMFIYEQANSECNSDVGIAERLDLGCDDPIPVESTTAGELVRCCCE